MQGFLPALILLFPIETIDKVGLPLVFHLLPIQTDVGRVLRSLDSVVIAGLRNSGRTISLKLLIWKDANGLPFGILPRVVLILVKIEMASVALRIFRCGYI